MVKKKDNEKDELKNTVEKFKIENLNLTSIIENYKKNISITKRNGNGTKSNGV